MSSPVVDCFIDIARRLPERVALIEGERRITFFDLREQVRAYAAYLENRGIGKGDCVLVYVPMGAPLYVILIALWYRGATAVFVDAWTSRHRIQFVADRIRCKAFIGVPKAHLLRLRSNALRQIPVKLWVWPWSAKATDTHDIEPIACHPDDTALVTFTTGSTGTPKGADRTHRFLLAQQTVLSDHLGLEEGAVDLATLPVFVLSNLAQGVTTVLGGVNPAAPELVDPMKLSALVRKHGVSCTAGSPIIYDIWATHCLEHGIPAPDLDKIFLGGAPVFPELAERLIAAFPDTHIEIVYGSTEAEPISAIMADALVASAGPSIGGSLPVGKPVPQIDVIILEMTDDALPELTREDFQKRICAVNCVGEICVRGQHVLSGYVGDPEAQARTKIRIDNEVWHRTGDAGYLDDAGHLFLLGRVGSRIRFDDCWLFALPIEHALGQLDGVRAGTIVEAADQLHVVVELETRAGQGEHDAIAGVMDVVAPGAKFTVSFQQLPRDPRHNSKIDYGQLRIQLVKGLS